MGFLGNAFQKLQEAALDEMNKPSTSSGKEGGNKSRRANRGENHPPAKGREGFSSSTDSSSNVSSVSSLSSMTMAEVLHYGTNTTRWEKTVVAANSLVNAVHRFDPDGVDIVCVGGGPRKGVDGDFARNDDDDADADADADADGAIETFGNIADTTAIEEKITARDPGGSCPLGEAVDAVLREALREDVDAEKRKRPCSVLVLTAGKPDDAELLEETLRNASQTVADRGGVEACPLSVSFVQIGKDEDAERYLRYLDKKMIGYSGDTDEKVDIVDTMGYLELKSTVDFIGEERGKRKEKRAMGAAAGTVLGVLAGAAVGVGGAVLAGRKKLKEKRAGGGKPGVAGVLGAAAAGIAGAAAAGFAGYAIQKRFFDRVESREECDYVLVLDRSGRMDLED